MVIADFGSEEKYYCVFFTYANKLWGRLSQYAPPLWPWPFDLENGVTCDVGYLCANFSLLRPLCST